MMSPDSSSELERMYGFGRSVCTMTFGLRGSETSTPVKFFGALSCASQMMRRPSFPICTDMPSPMPPKPPRSFCARSLKFQVTGSALLPSGLLAADIVYSNVRQFLAERPARGRRPCDEYVDVLRPSPFSGSPYGKLYSSPERP